MLTTGRKGNRGTCKPKWQVIKMLHAEVRFSDITITRFVISPCVNTINAKITHSANKHVKSGTLLKRCSTINVFLNCKLHDMTVLWWNMYCNTYNTGVNTDKTIVYFIFFLICILCVKKWLKTHTEIGKGWHGSFGTYLHLLFFYFKKCCTLLHYLPHAYFHSS